MNVTRNKLFGVELYFHCKHHMRPSLLGLPYNYFEIVIVLRQGSSIFCDTCYQPDYFLFPYALNIQNSCVSHVPSCYRLIKSYVLSAFGYVLDSMQSVDDVNVNDDVNLNTKATFKRL